MPSKEMIGRVLSTGSATVGAEQVAEFARALGDPNPLYVDPDAARHGPFGTLVAPPTYPIAFMTQAMAGGMDTFLESGGRKLGSRASEPVRAHGWHRPPDNAT